MWTKSADAADYQNIIINLPGTGSIKNVSHEIKYILCLERYILLVAEQSREELKNSNYKLV